MLAKRYMFMRENFMRENFMREEVVMAIALLLASASIWVFQLPYFPLTIFSTYHIIFMTDDSLIVKPKKSGLAPLILTLVELLRQLMEAQVIRRMDSEQLTESEIERAANSLQALEQQIFNLCEVLEIDPEDLNLDLGEFGKLLPKRGAYYPDKSSSESSILELLDRLITTGIVLEGDVQIGLADINLIDLKLKLLLTSGDKSASWLWALR